MNLTDKKELLEQKKLKIEVREMELEKLMNKIKNFTGTVEEMKSIEREKQEVEQVINKLKTEVTKLEQELKTEMYKRRKTMTGNEYQNLAMLTNNKNLSQKEHLINGVMGMCGEAGECIDMVKKMFMQGHELDKKHIEKELGDVLWYIAETATALDLSLDEIMQKNIDKLQARYPEGFEVEKSLYRKKGDV